MAELRGLEAAGALTEANRLPLEELEGVAMHAENPSIRSRCLAVLAQHNYVPREAEECVEAKGALEPI
jgi:hypothetical protein